MATARWDSLKEGEKREIEENACGIGIAHCPHCAIALAVPTAEDRNCGVMICFPERLLAYNASRPKAGGQARPMHLAHAGAASWKAAYRLLRESGPHWERQVYCGTKMRWVDRLFYNEGREAWYGGYIYFRGYDAN